jgi:hypothetical protein
MGKGRSAYNIVVRKLKERITVRFRRRWDQKLLQQILE